MKILILGFGKTGQAVYDFLIKRNEEVYVYDQKVIDIENYYSYDRLKEELPFFDLCIRSPGISKLSKIYLLCVNLAKKIVSDIEFSLPYIKSKHLICVTGSNGKTSTCLMINHIMKKRVNTYLLGNIGEVLISSVDKIEENDIVIIELSSFMLEDTYSLRPEVAIITSLSPNHLNETISLETYYASKKRLLINGFDNIICDNKTAEMMNINDYNFKFYNIDFFNTVFNKNANLAIECCKYYGISEEESRRALLDFNLPNYRQEVIKISNGLTFVNDSKSTSSDSTNSCLEEYVKQKRILILEGIFKGNNISEFDLDKVDVIYSYGEISALLPSFIIKKDTLKEILIDIYDRNYSSHVVIFSPGGSSLDLYKSYIDRGEEFNKLVNLIW